MKISRRIRVAHLAAILLIDAGARAETLGISDEDVVMSAVARSPDLEVRRVDRDLFRLEERRQRALLSLPVLSLDGSWRQGRRPAELYSQSASGTVDETALALTAALRGRTDYGTSYELRFDNRRETTSAYADFFPLSPLYRSVLSLSVVQPLLRGASPTVNRAPIVIAAKQARASVEALRAQAEQLVADAVERYLVWAGRLDEIAIRRSAVDLSRQLRQEVAIKVKSGTKAVADLAQADATVAARETEVVDAERLAREAERELLRIAYLDGVRGFRWSSELAPSTTLAEPTGDFDVEQTVAVALQERPAIREQEELLRVEEERLSAIRLARWWRLDARAQVGATGLAGTLNPAGPAPVDTIPNPNPPSLVPGTAPLVPGADLIGSPLTAIVNPYRMGTLFYLVGLTLEVPLSNAPRSAELAQAERQLDRRRAELQRTRNEIAVAVRAAVMQLRSDRERARLSREAVRLADANLAAEQLRYRGGVSTTFDVLRVQAEQSAARLGLTRTLVQINISMVRLQRESSRLLQRYHIDLQ